MPRTHVRPRRLLFILLALTALVPGFTPPATASHIAGTRATIGAPFTGDWGLDGDPDCLPYTNPPNYLCTIPPWHHRPFGGDWGVDFYEPPGVSVRPKIWSDDYRYAATLKLAANGPSGKPNPRITCSSGVESHGGKSVRINVVIRGVVVGWVDYSHLASVPTTLKAGSVVTPDTVIGKTGSFSYTSYSSCYAVSNSAGVHVHIEAYNNSSYYSCYVTRSLGAEAASGRRIGLLGGHDTSLKACPANY